MASSEVAGFSYISASGRVQYAFAPHPIYEQGTGKVACIVANASDQLDELAPIEIGGEALQYAMNVAKKTDVFDKVTKGQVLDSVVLERMVWKDTPDLVIYSIPALLFFPFGFIPIYGKITDPEVYMKFADLGQDAKV